MLKHVDLFVTDARTFKWARKHSPFVGRTAFGQHTYRPPTHSWVSVQCVQGLAHSKMPAWVLSPGPDRGTGNRPCRSKAIADGARGQSALQKA